MIRVIHREQKRAHRETYHRYILRVYATALITSVFIDLLRQTVLYLCMCAIMRTSFRSPTSQDGIIFGECTRKRE